MTPSDGSKGERTRERLFEAAVARFVSEGYEDASLRSIAADAGVTPGLLYRYFDGKEAVVTELYGRALAEWAERSAGMPRGTWVDRTLWLTRLTFEVLGPYRELLRVLAGSMVEGDPVTSPLHRPEVRRVTEGVFGRAIAEALDRPRDPAALVDLAYVGHLGLVLFWVMDRSPDQQAATRLMKQADGLGGWLRLGLKMPGVGGKVRGLGRTILGGLRGEEA